MSRVNAASSNSLRSLRRKSGLSFEITMDTLIVSVAYLISYLLLSTTSGNTAKDTMTCTAQCLLTSFDLGIGSDHEC